MGEYNRLTPLKFIRRNNKSIPFWLFKCDCGNGKIMNLYKVRSGETKSCGCSRRAYFNGKPFKLKKEHDLTGVKINHLTGVRLIGCSLKHRNYLWLFRCDCGNEIVTAGSSVRYEHARSCGCTNKIKTRTNKSGDIEIYCKICGKFTNNFNDEGKGRCKNCASAYYTQRYKENKEKLLSQQKRRWLNLTPEQKKRIFAMAVASRKKRDENKEYRKERLGKRRLINKHNCDTLADSYIKPLLTRHSGLTWPDIPDEMVKAKREQILFTRTLKQAKEALNGHDSN